MASLFDDPASASTLIGAAIAAVAAVIGPLLARHREKQVDVEEVEHKARFDLVDSMREQNERQRRQIERLDASVKRLRESNDRLWDERNELRRVNRELREGGETG